MPTWIMRRGSTTPSSTARRNGVPWKYFEPKYSSHVSGWASKWMTPSGPCFRAGFEHRIQPPLDGLERALDRDRHDVHVPAVRHAQHLERVHLQDRMPRAD